MTSSLRRPAGKPVQSPWRAVGVVPGGECCQASRSTAPQRFLCREAPRLPLTQCSNPAGCHCTYKHFDDRRQESRRALDAARMGYLRSSPAYHDAERRRQPDRRKRDY